MPFLFLIAESIRLNYYFDSLPNLLLFYFRKFTTLKQCINSNSIKMATKNDETQFAKVVFMGGDKQHSYETSGRNVIVVGSGGTHDHGSSKIKLKNMVDYKWEVKNYVGRLISVHNEGQYVAYAIKVNGKNGKPEGMVRVVNPVTGQRSLIRGKSNEVLDLQFAHMKSPILLASIEESALLVHRIETNSSNIVCTMMLIIEDPLADYTPKYDRISWCPSLADSDSDAENAGHMIVWTRGNVYQCYNTSVVVEHYGIGTHKASDLSEGSQKQVEPSLVTGAVLSPDGTTLAVTFEDGNIRFYQMYFHASEEESPRLLHQWTPYKEKPVTSLFFLDDYSKNNDDASLWKYAITASDNNTEVKVWCCSTWECIQTVVFKEANDKELHFKAEIDPTSSYLILTDTKSRGLYVLQIAQSIDAIGDKSKSDESKKGDDAKPNAFIKSISEFPLSSPILSFGILNATMRKYKSAFNDDMYLLEDAEEYEDESSSNYCVVINLFLVQPKSVQECHILFQPTLSALPIEASAKDNAADAGEADVVEAQEDTQATPEADSNESDPLINALCSSANAKKSPVLIKNENNLSHQSLHSSKPATLNLMTPDSFHSSGKITPEGVSNEVYNALRMLAAEKPADASNLFHMVKSTDVEKIELKFNKAANNGTSQNVCGAAVSGGSSPSREVQEILSLQDADMNDFYNDSLEHQEDTDGSGNNVDADAVDANEVEGNDDDNDDEEKNSNQDDDDTYMLTQVNNVGKIAKPEQKKWPNAPDVNSHAFPTQAQQCGPSLGDINTKLDRLLEVVQAQNCRIAELQNELVTMKSGESLISRFERENNKKLAALMAQNENQTREIRESILNALPPIIYANLSQSLTQHVLADVKRVFMPLVAGKLDSMKAQMLADVNAKLTTSDRVVKESIANFCKSKETMEIFGHAVAQGVHSGIQRTYTETMKSYVLPAYEKANAELFKQLHDLFSKGAIGFTKQLSTYTQMYEPIHNELLNLMRSVPEQLRSLNDATVTTCTQKVTNEVNKDLKMLQTNLLKTLKDNIKSEIKRGFESQAATLEDSVIMAVRSQAQTPAPSIYDIHEQIKGLLHTGQINKAFHQALLANDLHLVEFALERADYSQVFNPCPLEQTVLLSLVQQISADMSNYNELKQKYLSDAIVNLNFRDPITKEHAPKVLKELLQNCQNYIVANQHNNSGLVSSVRMLMMAIQGLGINLNMA